MVVIPNHHFKAGRTPPNKKNIINQPSFIVLFTIDVINNINDIKRFHYLYDGWKISYHIYIYIHILLPTIINSRMYMNLIFPFV